MSEERQPDLDFTSEKLKSMAATVWKVINEYPAGYQFHGNELHNDVTALYPEAKTMYTDTVQRAMRRYCRHLVLCINRNKSLYKKIGEG